MNGGLVLHGAFARQRREATEFAILGSGQAMIMPIPQEIEQQIRSAEAQARTIAQSSSLAQIQQREVEEFHIATELFPQLDADQRGLLVGLQTARAKKYPDNDGDEEGLTGLMKGINEVDYCYQKIKNASFVRSLEPTQRLVLRERYGLTSLVEKRCC